MPDKITVRQWQEQYRSGAFAQEDEKTKGLAGWSDFDCPQDDRNVQALVKLVMGITHPLILDEYHIYFVEHRPNQGPRYGSVCFDPLTGKWNERMFSVDLDCPFSREKWGLYTRRYGEGEPEFECGNIRRMLRYIHTMAHELEYGIDPPFWEEKKAAEQFVFERGCYGSVVLHREGEHSYSYWDLRTDSRKVVHVGTNAPSGSQTSGGEEINGLYVYEGPFLPARQQTAKKSQKKKKGPER